MGKLIGLYTKNEAFIVHKLYLNKSKWKVNVLKEGPRVNWDEDNVFVVSLPALSSLSPHIWPPYTFFILT